jgi:DNA replicative helicase MCM subunit Mcm2 (Cdc46/Mcm family)
MDNVELSDPILSRFDILCVVKDEVRTDLDSKLVDLTEFFIIKKTKQRLRS